MFRALGRDNWLVMASLLFWGLGEGLWYNLRQIYLRDLGATPDQIGLALAIENIGRIVLLIPTGYLIDRIGPRALMIGSWVLGIFGVGLMGLGTTWQGVTAGLFLYATSAFAVPAFSAFALMAAPPGADPQRTLSVLYIAFPIGLIVSPIVGGYIAQWAGSIRLLTWIALALYLISTTILVTTRHVKPHPRERKFHFGHLLGNRAYVGRSIYFAIGAAAVLVGFMLVPNFLQETRQLPLETIGALFSVFSIGTVVLNLLIGRIPPRWSFPAALAIFWAAALIIWQIPAIAGIGVGFWLMGAAYCLRPSALARLEGLIKPEDRGMAFSLLEMLFALATAAAARAAGRLFELTPQHDLPFIVSLVAIPLVIVAWFALRLWRTAGPVGSPTAAVTPLVSGEK